MVLFDSVLVFSVTALVTAHLVLRVTVRVTARETAHAAAHTTARAELPRAALAVPVSYPRAMQRTDPCEHTLGAVERSCCRNPGRSANY